MEARRRVGMLVGVAGVVVLTACGGGNPVESAAGVRKATAGQAARQSPTTTAPAAPATTRPAAPSAGPAKSTPKPAPTPTTTPTTVPGATVVPPADHIGEQPGMPRLVATPDNAPAGTRVRLEGHGFTGDPWQSSGGYLWLAVAGGQLDCEVYAQAEHDVHVSPDGHLTGTFVVPATGVCRYGPEGVSTAGHWYEIAYQCTVCRVGTFSVAGTEEPTGTNCDGYVVFGPGEDLAGDIYADGLSCDEAKAFLQAHAEPTGAVNGADHLEAEGFSCDRTGQSDVHLPRSNYKCTRDAQAIFFVRT
jgi:hypothetical protein